MAIVTTNLAPNNSCPNASFDSVKIIADTAWANYHNPPLGVNDAVVSGQIPMCPNPAHDKLFIERQKRLRVMRQ